MLVICVVIYMERQWSRLLLILDVVGYIVAVGGKSSLVFFK